MANRMPTSGRELSQTFIGRKVDDIVAQLNERNVSQVLVRSAAVGILAFLDSAVVEQPARMNVLH